MEIEQGMGAIGTQGLRRLLCNTIYNGGSGSTIISKNTLTLNDFILLN